MFAHKYYCRPVNEESEQAALGEFARYIGARNDLLRLKRKWTRITEDRILPEFRELAKVLRATPRVGRKPTKERGDREELRAQDNRTLYAQFIEAGGSYATWWLADAAVKKAKHMLSEEDMDEGRAGILPKQMHWDGSILNYYNTKWSVSSKALRDRPIPEGVRIAQAWLQRERTSCALLNKPRYSWYLVVVLDMALPSKLVPIKRGIAGMDLAWRTDDDTLRVAYMADTYGVHAPVRMMADNYARFQHAESLQGLADQDANRLKAELGLPFSTSQKTLVARAPEHPLTKHMIHLVDWHFGARRNALASRNAHYLSEIQELCRTYHTIYVEDIKGTPALIQKPTTRKKKLKAVKPSTEAVDSMVGGVARDQRTLAAPFIFLRMLQQEAVKFGTKIIKVLPQYTSRICTCGHDMGKGSVLERRCQKCGIVWDVDHLAARNILNWGIENKADAAE